MPKKSKDLSFGEFMALFVLFCFIVLAIATIKTWLPILLGIVFLIAVGVALVWLVIYIIRKRRRGGS